MTHPSEPLPKLSALSLPFPTDWAALFGRERPLILEIGFGRGVYLMHLAARFPDRNLIGLEISNQCLVAAEGAIARAGLTHVRVIHSKAETALHHLFTPASLEQVYINFPDPWFKTDHQHRRLMQRDTVDALVSRLKPGGKLFLATDITAYAEMSHALLLDTPGLKNDFPTPWVGEIPGGVVTKYQAKARAEGRPAHYFAYTRTDAPPPPVPVLTEVAMPHIVFRSSLDRDQIAARFAPLRLSDPARGLHVHISEAYVSTRHATVLFEAHVVEPTIEQHTGLTLVQRRADTAEGETGADRPAAPAYEYVLQLTTFGHARPTDGMHFAVAGLGEWLLGLGEHAGVVVNHKLRPAAARALEEGAADDRAG